MPRTIVDGGDTEIGHEIGRDPKQIFVVLNVQRVQWAEYLT